MCVETSSAASLHMGSLTWLVAEGLATLHTTRPGFCGFYQHWHTPVVVTPVVVTAVVVTPAVVTHVVVTPVVVTPVVTPVVTLKLRKSNYFLNTGR